MTSRVCRSALRLDELGHDRLAWEITRHYDSAYLARCLGAELVVGRLVGLEGADVDVMRAGPVLIHEHCGRLVRDKDALAGAIQTVEEWLEQRGAGCLCRFSRGPTIRASQWRLESGGFVSLSWHAEAVEEPNATVVTPDVREMVEVQAFLDETLGSVDETDSDVHLEVVVRDAQEGLCCAKLDPIGTSLERENYDPVVVAQFDRVVSELRKPQPCGRLVLLEGEPGTGKTYLVRALAHELKGQRFVYVPTDVMGSLDQPGVVELFTGRRGQGPINLIVEDADAVVIERRMDTAKVLSTMLNMTDGLLGKLLDVRVIATVNMMRDDTVDRAVLRKGRMLERMLLRQLNCEQSDGVYRRLTGRDGYKGRGLLSDIYAAAYEVGGGS